MEYTRFLRDNAPWLLAGFVLTLTSSFGQTFFISIFAGAIREEFGLSHGAWGGIYTLGTSASAVVMIWAGVLTDRYRVRHLGATVMALLAGACLMMAAVPNALALPFVIFALRFTGQGMIGHAAVVSTARWFVATRGRALSVIAMGFAFGQAVFPLIFVALLGTVPWRALWIVVAVFSLVTFRDFVRLLRHERTPQAIAKANHSLGMSGRQWVRSDVIKHWLFWLMFPTLVGPSAWGTALFFQQVHLAEVKGWSHVEFVALFPLFTVTSIISTFVTGWALDRVGTNRMMPFYLLPFAIAFFFLGSVDTIAGAGISMMVLGFGVGAGSTLPGAFWAEHFGTKNLGAIKALATAIMVFGSAIGPGITGWLIDLGIDFPDQMVGISVYFIVAASLATVGVIRARPLLAVAA